MPKVKGYYAAKWEAARLRVLGIKQKEIARRTGVSFGLIRKWCSVDDTFREMVGLVRVWPEDEVCRQKAGQYDIR